MKRILVPVAALGLLAGFVIAVAAQDGPVSVGSDTVARPRKSVDSPGTTPPAVSTPATPAAAPPELPKIPSKLAPKSKQDGDAPSAVFSTDASLVTVDVAVLDNKNNFVPRIGRQYFRVLEDNVPQTIRQFSVGEAPMTVALVIEFSRLFQWYGSADWYFTLTTANQFLSTLRPDDYAAIIRYDLRTQIVSDFTNNRMALMQAMRTFTFPDFSEANVFDALTDTADRMSKIEGRKAILLLSSGVDTFSKLTFDQTRRKLQDAGVPIYSIGLLQMINPAANQGITLLQAQNQIKTFTKETGGQAFFPRWQAELPEAFGALQSTLRSQYTLAYTPSNQARDGKFRKITVQLIDPTTNLPLTINEESKKPKPIKYTIVATPGYKAPHEVE